MNLSSVKAGRRLWAPATMVILALAFLLGAGFVSGTIAQTGDCQSLLPDGSFETGAGWTVQSSGSYPLLSNYLARSGAQAAYLAGVDGAADQLSTTLALPVDQHSITLRFWWQVHSEEESADFDGLSVLVADAAGNPLESFVTLGSANANETWQQSSFDLTAYGGQTVQLQLRAQTDSSLVTDFFVDDADVTACATGINNAFELFLPSTRR